MAWTYTNDPTNVPLDELRLLVGDIDGGDPQLTDEEMLYYLTDDGSTLGAAIAAVQGLIALFARKVDKASGDLRLSYSQRKDNYEGLLNQLQRKMSTRHATPVAGGLSKARKKTVEQDTDRVAPAIVRDQFTYPGTEAGNDLNLPDA